MLQVKYSVLERGPEKSGLAQQCKDLNVALIAHSPLEQGILTGEPSAETYAVAVLASISGLHQPACSLACLLHCLVLPSLAQWKLSGWPGCFAFPDVSWCMADADKYIQEGGGGKADKARPLLKLMQFIGMASGGRSVTQVALSYLVRKGGALCLAKS